MIPEEDKRLKLSCLEATRLSPRLSPPTNDMLV
uniref:Uncharacterized protein n=1 Tax=Amphimedon queenslandica TaxID=400682 RepID=A0A1X7UM04_AMPQE